MDDPRAPLEGHERFGLPVLKVGAVLALTLGILGLGYFGPHPAGPSTSSRPSSSAAASVPTDSSSPSASALPPESLELGLGSLKRVDPAVGQVTVAWLPGQTSRRTIALLGRHLFYVVGDDRIESINLGAGQATASVVTAGACEGITQLVAAGHELAYVITSPGGPTTGCGDQRQVHWSIWLLDLNGGSPRRVGSGTYAPNANDAPDHTVHLALTDSAYAFNRPADPAAGVGETIEMHALDGRLLRTAHTAGTVAAVLLGGSTLAVLTDEPLRADGRYALWDSQAGHPDLAPVDRPGQFAALSPDGSYLAWDTVNQGPAPTTSDPSDVTIEAVASGFHLPLAAPTDRTNAAPLSPAVWSVEGQPVVTWFATAPDGIVYPAIRYAAGGPGVFLSSLQQPTWMQVQDGMLVWVAENSDGWSKAAFAVDIASLGLS